MMAQLACCLYLYFHCFRQSDCLASWVCGLLSTRSTRDTQQSLLASVRPVPKQQLCRHQPKWPLSCDLEEAEASSENSIEERLSGEAVPGLSRLGLRRNTRPWPGNSASSRPFLLSIFVPNCYWFLQIRVILLVTESSSKSLRTSLNDFTSSRHHQRSGTGNCLHRKVR